MDNYKPLVVITGISGYVGSQICLTFLRDGTFRVRGTVRSKTNPKKIDPLKEAFGDLFNELELVEADLLDQQSLIRACQGADYIVHTASPFPLNPTKDEASIVTPAVEGTKSIMDAARLNKVKRVVITSSVVAIYITKDQKKRVFTSADWSDTSICTPYDKSKTLAEKAAWDYQRRLPASEKFEVVSINPGLVFGPSLVKNRFSSGDVLKKFMHKELPALPYVQLPIVDIRNVAQAHLQALKVKEAANKRFVLVKESWWFHNIGKAINEKYGSKAYNCSERTIPKFLAQVGQIFIPEVRLILPKWGQEPSYVNTEASRLLRIDWIPPQQSVQDMAETLINLGYVEDKRRKREARM